MALGLGYGSQRRNTPGLGGGMPMPGAGAGYSGPGLTRTQTMQKPTAYRGLGSGGGGFTFGGKPSFGGGPRTFGNLGGTPGMAKPPEPPPPPERGSESGPGILESWFNQRAQGIDAASQYATKRGLDALGDRYAAAGSFNSGARGQQESDLLANIEAQRAGQLDALAAGASGEHQGRLNSQFNQGIGLASGQSGINTAYDIKAADAQSEALKAALGFYLNKAGVDDKSRQQGINNLLGLGALFA